MTEDHGKSTIQIQVSHSLLRNERCSCQDLELITTIKRVIQNTEGYNSVLVKKSHKSFLL